MRPYLGAALLVTIAAAACSSKNKTPVTIQTVGVERRDIVIDAQATGVVEPINVVEVKSKASGLITRMTVETGDFVRPGELLVQIDTRDVQNQLNQAEADLRAAEARYRISSAQKRRADEMFGSRIITAQEHESATLDYANSEASVVRARASLDLAKQRFEDATITAPVAGTIIDKTVSIGQVIVSATGTVGGGTTLLKMADLNRVRVRALFNETDIGLVRGGQPASVVVDAYPNRRFDGVVEKIEPQAVVQQNVTMFPVLVTLDNREGLLKPGMNGETSVLIDQRTNVLAVPNEAVRNPREAMVVAPMLGLNPDSVQAQLRNQQFGGRGAMGGGQGPVNGRATQVARGDVVLSAEQERQGRGGQGGGFQMPQVTDAECAAVTAAMEKHPAQARQLADLRTRMMNARESGADPRALNEQMRPIYEAVGLDPRVAGACLRRTAGGAPQVAAAPGAAPAPNAANPARGQQAAGRPQTAPQAGALQTAPEMGGGRGQRRTGLVFVAEGGTYKPRVVMLGQGNFDYTEVLGGLEEGDQVVLLASLALQAQRQAQQDRMRQGMGGVPGITPAPGGGGRGGPPGGGRGGN